MQFSLFVLNRACPDQSRVWAAAVIGKINSGNIGHEWTARPVRLSRPYPISNPQPSSSEQNSSCNRRSAIRCLVGGSRSGKTTLLVREIANRALRVKDSRHAILRLRANAARASIALDTLPKVFRLWHPDELLKRHRTEGYFSLENGSEIWIGGLDDQERVEKILGKEYATIFLNECSQIPYSSVLVALTRLAQVADGLTAGRLLRPQSGRQRPLDQCSVWRKARSDLAPAARQSGRLRADVSQSERQCRKPDRGRIWKAWSVCRSGSASASSKASMSTTSTARCSAMR